VGAAANYEPDSGTISAIDGDKYVAAVCIDQNRYRETMIFDAVLLMINSWIANTAPLPLSLYRLTRLWGKRAPSSYTGLSVVPDSQMTLQSSVISALL
jgi:hypothetical protein